MAVDRCPKSDNGNHIYQASARQVLYGITHECVYCGRVAVFDTTTKEWK